MGKGEYVSHHTNQGKLRNPFRGMKKQKKFGLLRRKEKGIRLCQRMISVTTRKTVQKVTHIIKGQKIQKEGKEAKEKENESGEMEALQ